MNTITFGTTSEPHRFAAGRGQPEEEFGSEHEFDDKGNIDPDRLLHCPFDKNHKIRACRFPYHLIKCRKNHPKLASELKTCPYNARHLVPKHELNHHMETCKDRMSVDTMDDSLTNGEGNNRWQVPVSTWVNSNPTEDWDEGGDYISCLFYVRCPCSNVKMTGLCPVEAADRVVPFVWGVNTALNARREMRPMNNLGPSCRVPNTLPWSSFKP